VFKKKTVPIFREQICKRLYVSKFSTPLGRAPEWASLGASRFCAGGTRYASTL